MKKTLRASNKEARSQPEELLPAREGVSSGMAPRVFRGSSGFSSAPAKKELRRLCFLKELHSGCCSERREGDSRYNYIYIYRKEKRRLKV